MGNEVRDRAGRRYPGVLRKLEPAEHGALVLAAPGSGGY